MLVIEAMGCPVRSFLAVHKTENKNIRHCSLVGPFLKVEISQREIVVNGLDVVGENLAVSHLVRISCSGLSRAESRLGL